MLAHFEDYPGAVEAGYNLAHEYLAPAAMIVLDRAALWKCGLTADWPWTLALKLEGYRRVIEPARDVAARMVRAAGGRVEGSAVPPGFWDQARDWPCPSDEAEAVLYGITSLTGLKALMPVAAEAGSCMVQPAAGVLQLRVPVESAAVAVERLRQAAGDEGQVVIARAPVASKQTLDVWGAPPPSLPLMRSIKAALDPNGILNPGRFVGGI